MALSYNSIQKAYKVFNDLKKTVIPELSIPSFPQDMRDWSEDDRETPSENQVYGFDKKSDGGWENIIFFVKNPSEELKQKFDKLKDTVPNSSLSKPYSANESLWIFGWF